MNIKEKKVIKYKCEKDFYFFARYFFKELQGSKFVRNYHHEEIANTLQAIASYKIGNTVFNLPPRYSKTELIVILFIAWSIAKNPRAKFIHLSYSDDLALDNSSKIKEVIEGEEYQELWQICLKPDSKSKKKWYTMEGGGLYATASGGSITGFGAGSTEDTEEFAGAIIIDDPHKVDDATRDTERNKVNNRLNSTIQSRRNSRKTPIIIVMQRLHEEDMTGFVLDGGMGEEFHHVCFVAEQSNKTPLWEYKHTWEELQQLKAANAYVYSGQYMQNPVPCEGGMVKLKWFNRYNTPPSQYFRIVQSWDTAIKATESSDYSVCTTWAETKNSYVLLDIFRDKLEYPDLKRTVINYSAKYNPGAILIEDKASGQQLLQDLRRNTILPVISINPEKDKITRMAAVSSMIEAGTVYLPNKATWLVDYEGEIGKFPLSKNDDQVDSTSQFLNWIRNKKEFKPNIRSL